MRTTPPQANSTSACTTTLLLSSQIQPFTKQTTGTPSPNLSQPTKGPPPAQTSKFHGPAQLQAPETGPPATRLPLPSAGEGSDNRNLDWPAAGNEDSSKLSVPGTTSGKSGKLTPSFTTAPDFESPNDTGGDKTYEVRLHNKHNLHNPSSDFPSCSGSAVDFKITIKDVGTPSLVTPTGQFATDDTTKVNLKWDAPTGFMEENETFVTFPHKAFAPSSYDYRYRNTPTDPWTEVNGITITSAPITGLTASTLQVQVRATNSEGTSPWPKESVTIVKLTQASISAVNPSINEGEDAEFLVTLDLISNLTVNLRYDWSGSHGYANTGTVTFTDSKSETLSIPTTTIGDSGSLTVTICIQHRLHDRQLKPSQRKHRPQVHPSGYSCQRPPSLPYHRPQYKLRGHGQAAKVPSPVTPSDTA